MTMTTREAWILAHRLARSGASRDVIARVIHRNAMPRRYRDDVIRGATHGEWRSLGLIGRMHLMTAARGARMAGDKRGARVCLMALHRGYQTFCAALPD